MKVLMIKMLSSKMARSILQLLDSAIIDVVKNFHQLRYTRSHVNYSKDFLHI